MKGKLSISRGSDELVCIRIRDEASGIEFVNLKMSLETYANAITGVAEQEGLLFVRGLQFVGKKLVIEQRQIACPFKSYDRKILEKWLIDNAQEDGWIVDPYLGSQKSFYIDEEKTVLNYSVKKYVQA